MLAESGDIVYPKLDEDKDMIPFDRAVKDMLDYMGLGCKACSTSEEAKAVMIDFSRVDRVETCRCLKIVSG